MTTLNLVHHDRYREWIFDPTHPTQGRRFDHGLYATQLMLNEQERDYRILTPTPAPLNELLRCHTSTYIEQVEQGFSHEWEGERPDLGSLARLFVGGTLLALDRLMDGEMVAVNLPGAKHHAQADHSSGFCVYNDFAIAAHKAAEQGYRVAIFDLDAHHGDGTENLTRDLDNVLTFSVHQQGIFPGTGLADAPDSNVYNEPLPAFAGGFRLLGATDRFLDLAAGFDPDLIFFAGGADGHIADPLSDLSYTLKDYELAARSVRIGFRNIPILFGGAGGYAPDGATPLSWATMIEALSR